MTRLVGFALLIALLIAPAAAQRRTRSRTAPAAPASQRPSSDDQALVALERHIIDAIRDKNSTALESFVAEDFQYLTATGETRDRARFLKDIASLPEEIEWLSADQMHVRVFGSIGVVTGVQQAKVRKADGSLVEARDGFTDVFRRTGSDWELVMVYAVELPTVVTPGAPPTHPVTPVEKPKPPRQ